jgi:hypothetical protein
MGAALHSVPVHRSPAEAALVEQTVTRLRAHNEPELAAAVESSRLKIHPFRHGRKRYWQAQVQVQVIVSGPEDVWARLPLTEEDVDRLLRSELAQALSPALFPRSVEIHAA